MGLSSIFDNGNMAIEKLIPIKRYDEKLNCFEMTVGEKFMDIVQISTKDLISENEQEKEYMNMEWAKFYKTCAADIKLIALNFPTNTSEQQKYIRYKIAKCKNPVFEEFLNVKLDELIYIERHNTDREYYMMFFADNDDKLKDIRDIIYSVLVCNDFASYITSEKKEMILYKYNNPNTALFVQPESREGE